MPSLLYFCICLLTNFVKSYYNVLSDTDAKNILLDAPGSQGTAVSLWDLPSALHASGNTTHPVFCKCVLNLKTLTLYKKLTASRLTVFDSNIRPLRLFIHTSVINAVSDLQPHSAEQSDDSV